MTYEKGSPWIIMSGFIIILAGAIFHIGVTITTASGKHNPSLNFIPYILYILGIVIALFGATYTPPRKKLFEEQI